MSANDKQVAGSHYKTMTPDIPQHWDIVALHSLDYFQGQITKYVMRWKNKNGIQDLQKALHFLEKYIEINSPKEEPTQVAINKYADDYQEKLSADMAKMREDAMIGIPDHLREEIQRAYTADLRERLDVMNVISGPQLKLKERAEKAAVQMEEMPESLQGVSPMLKNFWGADEEPLPHGYVNQDGHDVR